MGAGQFRSDARIHSIANVRLQRRIASLEMALNEKDSRIEMLTRQLDNAVRTIHVLRQNVFREIKDIKGSLEDMHNAIKVSPVNSRHEPSERFARNLTLKSLNTPQAPVDSIHRPPSIPEEPRPGTGPDDVMRQRDSMLR